MQQYTYMGGVCETLATDKRVPLFTTVNHLSARVIHSLEDTGLNYTLKCMYHFQNVHIQITSQL